MEQGKRMRGYRANFSFGGTESVAGAAPVEGVAAGALVFVQDDAIIGLVPASTPAWDGEVAYLPGAAVLPGLIDTRTHLSGYKGPGSSEPCCWSSCPPLRPPGAAHRKCLAADHPRVRHKDQPLACPWGAGTIPRLWISRYTSVDGSRSAGSHDGACPFLAVQSRSFRHWSISMRDCLTASVMPLSW